MSELDPLRGSSGPMHELGRLAMHLESKVVVPQKTWPYIVDGRVHSGASGPKMVGVPSLYPFYKVG